MNTVLFYTKLISFLLLISCLTVNNAYTQTNVMNWGIRLGLNAVSVANFEAIHSDEVLPNLSYTNKNGYFVNTFARFNMNRLFLQPELEWNSYYRSFAFSLPMPAGNSYYPPVNLYVDSKAINTSFLVGYNIVSNMPFLFGIYGGTSLKGIYRTDFSTDNEQSFPKTDLLLNNSGIIGISINISKIYFDLRYELNLPENNLYLKEIPDFPENFHEVMIKKTEAILSFSFGIMF